MQGWHYASTRVGVTAAVGQADAHTHASDVYSSYSTLGSRVCAWQKFQSGLSFLSQRTLASVILTPPQAPLIISSGTTPLPSGNHHL